MAYSELYQDPRWQKKRLRVMGLAKFACQWCEDTKVTLHVHHKHYRRGRKPWEYKDGELLCLCKGCHETATSYQDEAMRLVGELGSLAGLMLGAGAAYVTQCSDEPHIHVMSYEVAEGVGLVYRLSAEDVLAVKDQAGNPIPIVALYEKALGKMKGSGRVMLP